MVAFLLALVPVSGIAQSGYNGDRPQDRQAVALFGAGRVQEAETLLRRILVDDRQRLGDTHPNTIDTMERLAGVLAARQQLQEVLQLERYVYDVRRRMLSPDHPDLIRIAGALGQTLNDTGQATEAIPLLQFAASSQLARSGRFDPAYLAILNNQAVALARTGQTEKALVLQRTVVTDATTALGGDHPRVLGWSATLARMLVVARLLDEGVAAHAELVERLGRVLGPDHPDTLRTYTSYAGTLIEIGDLNEAELWLRRALIGNQRVHGNDSPQALTSALMLANTLNRMGRAEDVLALRTSILERVTRIYGETHPNTLQSQQQYASALSSLGRWDEAEPVLRNVMRNSDPSSLSHAITAHDLAALYYGRRQYAKSVALLTPLVATFRRLTGVNSPYTLTAEGSLAAALAETGDTAAAVDLLRDIIARAGDNPEIPRSDAVRHIVNLAVNLQEMNAPSETVALLTPLVADADRLFGNRSPVPGQVRLTLGHGLMSLGRHGEALGLLREARDRLARLALEAGRLSPDERRNVQALQARTAWFIMTAVWHMQETAGTPDAALINEAFEAGQLLAMGPSAFAFGQAAGRIAARNAGLESLVNDWNEARRAIGGFDARIAQAVAAGNSNMSADANRRAQFQARVASAERDLKRAFPAFFDLISPVPVSVSEVQGQRQAGDRSLLGGDEALILLATGLEGLVDDAPTTGPGFVFALTQETVVMQRLPWTGRELATALTALREDLSPRIGVQDVAGLRAPQGALETPRPALDARGFDTVRAHRIYAALFGAPEVADAIAGKDSWMLMPVGPLLSLPFGALVVEPPVGPAATPEDLRQTRWLGAERALTVIPASNMIKLRAASARGEQADRRQAYLGFGDPDYSGLAGPLRAASVTSQTGSIRAAVRSLPRLPGSGREVRDMAARLGAGADAIFLGSDVNEQSIAMLNETGRLSQARIIHFATHGLLSNEIAGISEPAIALTPPAETAPAGAGDGLLTATEVSLLRLNADWVILSACNTAAGNVTDGMGLTGLALGFHYAGARNLLVTHWEIRDDVAARLMTSIADQNGRQSRGAALRDAVRAVLADRSADDSAEPFSHPAVWASFQIVGADGLYRP